MIEWAWTQFLLIWQDPQVRGVAAGLLIGIFAAESIAHMLPPSMEAAKADRLTRLLVFGLATVMAFLLVPSRHGLVWAVMTGVASPTLHQLGTRFIYSRWPWAEPKALKE